ncbi:MAG: hypothetical protein OHK0039_25440 [Bacteroidia bacterium]
MLLTYTFYLSRWARSLLMLGILLISIQQASAQCNANFSLVQAPGGCAADSVQFTALANPATVASYFWTFGDGQTSTLATPQHLYAIQAATVNYTVTLTVTDTSGATCNTQQTVTVQGVPPIVATLSQPFFCAPDTLVNTITVTLTIDPASLGQGPFVIDFGDGSAPVNSAGPIVNHTYTTYGTFYITITANGNTCPGFYREFYFYTDPVAAPEIVGQPFICEGQTITVRNNSDVSRGNIDYFIWDWGQFGPTYITYDTTAQSYTFNLDSVNICVGLPFSGYSDGVTLRAFNRCSDHFTFSQIRIRAQPRADFDWPEPVCLPNAAVLFTNQSCPVGSYVDPASFTWVFENTAGGFDTVFNVVNPVYTYTQPGFYTVTLIAQNNCGIDTRTRTAEVIAPPVAQFTMDNPVGCINFCTDITNTTTPTSDVNYLWQVFADTACWDYADTTQTANSFEPGFCFSCPDTFPIRLIATNVCGVDSTRDSVFARRPPQLSMMTIGDTCGVFTLDSVVYGVIDFGAPVTNYTWTFAGGTPATFNGPVPPPVTFVPGNNSVQLCVTNDCGTQCITRNFLVGSLTNVNAGNDISICRNDTLSLSGTPLPGFWQGPSVDSAGLFIPDTSGGYVLIYTHFAASCRVYDTLQVTVYDTPTVTILTPFTQACYDTSLLITLMAQQPGGTWTGPNLVSGNQFRADTAGTFTFTYLLPDSVAGCEGRGVAVIRIDTLPVATILTDTALYCYGNALEPLPTTSPTGGTWFGSVAIVGNQFNPGLLPGPDTLELYYQVVNGFGCRDTDTVVVMVVNPSAATAGPGDTLCFNHGLDTLAGQTPPGGFFGGGAYVVDPTQGIVNTLLMQPGNNPVTYMIFPGSSCETSAATFVHILDTLTVAIGPDIALCATDAPLVLTSSQPGGLWSGLGIADAVAGLYDPGLVPPGTSDVVCYVLDNGNGCSSRDCRIIFVDSLPIPGFGGPLAGCINVPLTFPYTSVYAPSHQWDYGDGTPLTASNTHTYTAAGIYTITQYAFSPNGCVDSVSRDIEIFALPTAVFTVNTDNGCGPLAVTFANASNVAGGTCTWDFGNGTTSTDCNPGTIVFQDGLDVVQYTVTLTVSNLCSTVSATRVITVQPRPFVIFDTQQDTGCSVLPVQFGNLTLGRPDDFFWYLDGFGPGSLFSTDSIPPVQYLAHTPDTGFTVYTIYLVSTNVCGADTGAQTVVVYPNTVDALFNTSSLQGCVPHAVNFADLSGAPTTGWRIATAAGTTLAQPIGDTVTYTFTVPGTYRVFHTADNTCSFDTNFVDIVVYPQPVVAFTTDTTLICRGDTVFFTNQSINAQGYAWTFGDGGTSNAVDPAHRFQTPGTFTVTLTALADTNACPASFSLDIVVLPPPAVAFTPSDTAGCPPLTLTFSGVPPGLSYLWHFGDGTSSNQFSPTKTYPNTGFYNIQLTVTNGQNCRNSLTRGVRVHEVPVADFVAVNDTVCGPGVPVFFQNLSTGDTILVYSWDFGDGSPLSSAFEPSHSYTAPGVYTVTLTTENIFTCADVITRTVVVLPQPVAAIGASDTVGCVPLAVSFADLSLNSSGREWLIDGGLFFGANQTVTFTSPADTCYLVRLVADTAGFCFDTATVQVCTAAPPVADFAPDQDRHCGAPATVAFDNAVSFSTRPYSVAWTFGDGGTSTDQNPSYTYAAVGQYVVSMTQTNDYGCTSSHTDTIFVYPQPVAAIGASDTVGCVPLAVSFADLSLNSSGREWLIDGVTTTAANPGTIFISPADTSYTIRLIADTAGFCFDTATRVIRTASPPVAHFTPAWDRFCGFPASNTFTNLSQASLPLTYSWLFGDGNSSVLPSPVNIYSSTGSFPVRLVVINTYGCTDTLQDTVRVYPQPQAGFLMQPDRGCTPLLVQFTNQSAGYSRARWDFGDQSGLSLADDPAHTYFAADTTFTVTLVVDTAGFCFDSTRQTVRTGSAPVADFEASLYSSCGPATVQLTNRSFSAVLGLSYVWYFGNGDSSSLVNPTVRYDQPGRYTVLLVAINSYGCRDTARRVIDMYPDPVAMFAADPLVVCERETVQFTDLSTDATRWLWDFGDGGTSLEASPGHVYDRAGLYSVRLVVSFDGQCPDTLLLADLIRVNQRPVAGFTYRDSTREPGLFDGTIVFTNTSLFADSYRWDFGNGDGSDLADPVYQYPVNGSYDVMLVAFTVEGCSDTLIQPVNPGGFGGLQVPTAMAPFAGLQPTPGDTTSGDLFTVFFPRGKGLTSYHIAVYAKWGDLLWESRALEDGVPTEWWDGRDKNGNMVSSGVCIWTVHEAIFENGVQAGYPRSGNLTLIR